MCGYIWAFDRYGFCDWFLRRNRFSKRNSTYNKQTIKLTQTPQHPYSNTWNWEFVMSKESPVCLLARSPSSTIIYIQNENIYILCTPIPIHFFCPSHSILLASNKDTNEILGIFDKLLLLAMPMPIHIWMCVQLAIVNNAFIAYSFFIHQQYWAFSLCSFIITTKATAITTTATTLTTTPTTQTAKSHKTGNTWTKNTAYNAITWWFQKRCTTLEHLKLKRDTQTTQFFIPDRPQNSSHWFLYFESIRTGNYCFRETDLLVFFLLLPKRLPEFIPHLMKVYVPRICLWILNI